MAPVVVLFGTFLAVVVIERVRGRREGSMARAGRIAVAVMFVFTGVSHFFFVERMAEMVPPGVPAPAAVVYVTGVLEILGAVGLLVERTRRVAAWCLLLFLLAVFPANVYAALNSTGLGGHTRGAGYLWVRAPLQALFVGWVAWFGILVDRRRSGLE